MELLLLRPMRMVWVCLLIGLTSCNSNLLIDTKAELTEQSWDYDNIPSFEFRIDDTAHLYNFFLNLRINENYRYRNIYLVLHLRDPEGLDIKNRINVELATPEGKWLGSGSGHYKTFQLPISSNLQFVKQGRYIIGIEQNMRDSVLKDVEYVGIAIKKGEPVF